ncbi:hypothetical protein UA08_04293 [Talaromyces atroroseus]|uniref:Xylanolytic transcriptional activator regulatory domain-containing protein n=1 Tax=Talaromyces atroroseus TaxID=1441469 RepID=A0A1Q5Q9P2_TALAT|nr:hypothetical protein UA08_04293 [Talaromyces atroroseus]OKL60782.1 hypothetical protein UA08_04293 [Talaromyces atroroseus]
MVALNFEYGALRTMFLDAGRDIGQCCCTVQGTAMSEKGKSSSGILWLRSPDSGYGEEYGIEAQLPNIKVTPDQQHINDPPVMNVSDGRRRRPAVNGDCIYENHHRPIRSGQDQTTTPSLNSKSRESLSIDRASSISGSSCPSRKTSSLVASSTAASTTTNALPVQDDESMRLRFRVRQLEDELSKHTLGSVQSPVSTLRSNIQTTTSHLAGTFHVHCESDSSGQPQGIARSVIHKSRLFGQSHWEVNGILLIRDIFETIEAYMQQWESRAGPDMERCKSLARSIKARRAPSWPSPPTPDIPPKEVSDTLVDCYLRTTEAIYRILHISTFRRDYDAFWVSDTAPDMVFLVQLKLVLAIGAITYDEGFSLRDSAIRWTYEAQTWLSEPKFKSRLDIRFLQINLLLLIAQEQVAGGGDSTWISIGALLRKAIHMGLHRDPIHLPPTTTFAAEMRRRLWNTILEIALQSSLAAGGPPLISLDDFDTACPSNFDDDQIVTDDPIPKASYDLTQVSIAIALRKTFPQRLAIAKFLNQFSSTGTYDEALRLDAELRAVYKELSRTLQACGNSNSGPSPSQFEIRVVDIIMHRFLSSLHLPYFGASLQNTAYAFSRKVVVDSALKIWRAAYSLSSSTAVESSSQEITSYSDDMMRLVVCSSGFYPTVAIHAAFVIGVELRAQLQEEESLGPVQLRPDLLSVLEEAKRWVVQGIEAGETSIKGFLLISVVSAHIEGLMRSLGKDEIAELLVRAAENVVKRGLPLLKEMAAAQGQGDGSNDGTDELPSTTSMDTMGDWNLLTSNDLFKPGDEEPMKWMFDDSFNPGMPSLW